MLRHIICLSAGIAFLATSPFAGPNEARAQEQIRWATSSVGSSGHRALVALATLLNREQDTYEMTRLYAEGRIRFADVRADTLSAAALLVAIGQGLSYPSMSSLVSKTAPAEPKYWLYPLILCCSQSGFTDGQGSF